MVTRHLRTLGFSKPHPSEVVSGDAYLFLQLEDAVRVVLVDGAGHGEAAAEAAKIATDSAGASAGRDIVAALAVCHSAMHGSRGAAVSIADVSRERIVFAGVGNVEGRLVTSSKEQRLVPQRGIAGVVIPTIRLEVLELASPEWALFLYSDGVSQKVNIAWETIGAVSGDEAASRQMLVDAVSEWGRLTDDATIALVLPD